MIVNAQNISLEPKQDSKKPLWGYVNPTTGKWMVKPQFTEAEPFKTGKDGKLRALVSKGNVKGFLAADGKPTGAGIVFESIEPMMSGDNLIVSVKGKKGIVTPDGVYVQKPEMSEIKPLGTEGYIVTIKGKKGVISPEGELKVEPLYSDILTGEDDVFIVVKGGKKGLLSRQGDMLLQPSKFEDISRLKNYWKVGKGNKIGLFDPSKRAVLVDAKYGDVLEPFAFPGGMIFPVKKTNGKWGAIDASGKEIIKCKNQELTPVPALNAIRVRRNNVGERLFFPKENLFLELSSWSENKIGPFNQISGTVDVPSEGTPADKVVGLSVGEHVSYDKNYAQRKSVYNRLGNKSFNIVTDKKGNSVGNNVTLAPLGNKWLIINLGPWTIYDSDGNKVKETDLTGMCTGYSDTQGWYADNNKVIFPDLKTYKIIVCDANLQFIDKDGQGHWIPMVNDIPRSDAISYNEVIALNEANASVRRNGKWGLFSTDTEILAPIYEAVISSSRASYIEIKDGKYVGLYNPTTKTWLLPLTEKIMSYEFYNSNSDSPILIYNGKWGLADAKGNITKPMVSDKNKILDSLKPKVSKPVNNSSKASKSQNSTKAIEKPKKKSNTEFQESKERRRF